VKESQIRKLQCRVKSGTFAVTGAEESSKVTKRTVTGNCHATQFGASSASGCCESVGVGAAGDGCEAGAAAAQQARLAQPQSRPAETAASEDGVGDITCSPRNIRLRTMAATRFMVSI